MTLHCGLGRQGGEARLSRVISRNNQITSSIIKYNICIYKHQVHYVVNIINVIINLLVYTKIYTINPIKPTFQLSIYMGFIAYILLFPLTSISFLGLSDRCQYLQRPTGLGSTTPAVYTACQQSVKLTRRVISLISTGAKRLDLDYYIIIKHTSKHPHRVNIYCILSIILIIYVHNMFSPQLLVYT